MARPFGPGACVGGMRIVREIGSGAVSTVYEVIRDGERCALKLLDGTVEGESRSTTGPDRMLQEGEAYAMIEHPNVVRWLDTGVHCGRPWLLLELVEGKNLRQIMREAGGNLPLEYAVALGRQACEGLAAIHKKGIVHRDVTPENILVVKRGEARGGDIAKIADLGSAKMPKWGVKTTNARRLSSMRYTPPEQWLPLSVEPSPAGDVFAMGMILYEMLTGVHPLALEGTDLVTLCTRYRNYEVPPLSSIAEVPGELSDLVVHAMTRHPADRCTARELADGLEVVQDRLLAWRRTAARSVPRANQEPGLALTAPMRVYPESPDEAASAELPAAIVSGALPAAAPAAGPRGTMLMPVVSSGAGDTQRSATAAAPQTPIAQWDVRVAERATVPASHPCESRDDDRAAAPPPAPSTVPTIPSTLRVLSRPTVVPSESMVAPKAIEPEEARRSTGTPVESSVRPSVAAPRWRATHVAVGGSLLVVLVMVAWWTLVVGGGESSPPPKPALPPPPVAASVTPPASVTRPTPSVSASASRPPVRPPVHPRR